MTRLRRREIRLLTLLGDLVALALAFEGAARLRVALNPFFRAQIEKGQMEHLVPPLGLVLVLWVVAAVWIGLYRSMRGPVLSSAPVQAAEAMAMVVLLTIVVTFFVRDFGESFSRSFVLFMAFLGVAAILANRLLIWGALSLAGRGGRGAESVLLVGRGRATRALVHRLERAASRSLRIAGVVTPTAGEGAGVLGNPVPVLGAVADLPTLINQHGIDRVIAVEREVPIDKLQACLSICARMGVPLNRMTGVLEAMSSRVGVTQIAGLHLVEVRGLEFTRAQEVVKRVFDLTVAAAFVLALAPLLVALALLVRLSSPGPVFYVAPRVGRGGRHFPFYKIRSMMADAERKREALEAHNEKRGHLFKMSADPRVTRLGRFMRRYSLDELPQLFNVLRGEMSLVGPRPLPAGDLDPDGLSREYRFWAKERTRVLPGITGLWQVRGRSDLNFEDMLRLDVSYARNWSIWLDVRILLETIPLVLRGRGAC